MKRYLLAVAALLITWTCLHAQEPVKTFELHGITVRLVYVEGATFMMGAQPTELVEGDLDEQVRHKVRVNSFYMLETPVTVRLWDSVFWNREVEPKETSNHPITGATYSDVTNFFYRLESQLGVKFRLPTEAEWEFAARGGRKTRGYRYSGGHGIDAVAWYEGNSGGALHDVAKKTPNELGLYDMSGLVWEMCSDWYDDYIATEAVQDSPAGPEDGTLRVIRGGSCNSDENDCRVVRRGFTLPKKGKGGIGFRFVMDVE